MNCRSSDAIFKHRKLRQREIYQISSIVIDVIKSGDILSSKVKLMFCHLGGISRCLVVIRQAICRNCQTGVLCRCKLQGRPMHSEPRRKLCGREGRRRDETRRRETPSPMSLPFVPPPLSSFCTRFDCFFFYFFPLYFGLT